MLVGLIVIALGPLLGIGTASASSASSWIPVAAPQPSNGIPADVSSRGTFEAVSCPGAGTCFAAGGFFAEGGVPDQSDVASLSDGAWESEEIPPSIAGDQSYLDAISCPSANSCTAAGAIGNQSSTHGMVDTLSGGMWTSTELPDPPGLLAGAFLDYVSCPAVAMCVVLGEYVNQGTDDLGLYTETESAGSWSVAAAPMPAGDTTYMIGRWKGLSCPSIGACTAVASMLVPECDNTCDVTQGVAESLSSGTWNATELPVPQDASTTDPALEPYGIDCESTNSCTAVGGYADTANLGQGVIETLADGTWSSAQAPLPTGGTDGHLVAVRCLASDSCVATGYFDAGGSGAAAIDTESAGVWTATAAPVPEIGATNSTLNAIECEDIEDCVAVGGYDDSTGVEHPLIDSSVSGSWSALEAPAPGDLVTSFPSGQLVVPQDDLSALACPTLVSCVALGTYPIRVSPSSGEASYSNESFLEDASTAPPPGEASSTELMSSASSTTYGDPVALTATVDNASGAGTVEFLDGGITIQGCGNQAVSPSDGGYVATCTTSSIHAGQPWLSAIYEGDTSSASSSGANTTLTVLQANQTVVFSSAPPSDATIGGPDYQIDAGGGGSGLPVVLSSATTSTCTVSGTTVTMLNVGPCTVDANQAGDDDYSSAPEVSQSFTIHPRPTFDGLTFPSPISFDNEAASSFVSAVTSPGGPTPVGSVAVTTGQETLCTANVNVEGTAHCSLGEGSLSPGRYTVISVFAPSSISFGGSQSSVVTLVITRSGTRVVATPAVVAQGRGWKLTMSARLTSSGIPTRALRLHFSIKGSRTFDCSAMTDSSGVARCSISGTGSFKKLGISRFKVVYMPSVDYTGSASTGSIHIS